MFGQSSYGYRVQPFRSIFVVIAFYRDQGLIYLALCGVLNQIVLPEIWFHQAHVAAIDRCRLLSDLNAFSSLCVFAEKGGLWPPK